jgi:uncharacterized protein (DUF2126 family)
MTTQTAAVIQWLTELGWDTAEETGAPLERGPYVPPMPNRIVVISPVPGPGFLMEGAADAGAFQARVRGETDDPDDAEALMFRLDKMIERAQFPATVGGHQFIHIHRVSARPAPLLPSPDSGRRSEYTCNYVAISAY